MAMFRQNFTSGVNYLRRHFSSDDLYQDRDDGSQAASNDSYRMNLPGRGKAMPTGPSFPTLSSVQDMTRGILSHAAAAASSVTDAVNSVASVTPSVPGSASSYGGGVAAPPARRLMDSKDHCKILLVIDDKHDWNKYFRNRKVCGDWDLKVYQADFASIDVSASSDGGAVVDLRPKRNINDAAAIHGFQPDFVLVRQHGRDATDNWKNVILGLHYGGVPSINSLHSIYNFLDKPWVFSHLLRIQRRLGSQRFPLIDQSYYPNHREMITNLWMVMPKFPVVVKVGHAHSGLGKVKVAEHNSYQDVAGVMAVADCYSTAEPHVDALCDIYVQKIGPSYRVYMRKGMSGNWKANVSTATLEQIPLNERYKLWVDECSQLFGGLDILAVKAIRAKDGREFIIEVYGSSMTLLGNTQDEDMRQIAEMTISRLQAMCSAAVPAPVSHSNHQHSTGSSNAANGPVTTSHVISVHQPPPSMPASTTSATSSQTSVAGARQLPQTPQVHHYQPHPHNQQQQQARPVPVPPRPAPQHQIPGPPYSSARAGAMSQSVPVQQHQTTASVHGPAGTRGMTAGGCQPPPPPPPPPPPRPVNNMASSDLGETTDMDDTMNNLRKTFAGIFGNT